MEITAAQFKQVEHSLQRQGDNVNLTNLHVLNTILYVTEHGCNGVACSISSATDT